MATTINGGNTTLNTTKTQNASGTTPDQNTSQTPPTPDGVQQLGPVQQGGGWFKTPITVFSDIGSAIGDGVSWAAGKLNGEKEKAKHAEHSAGKTANFGLFSIGGNAAQQIFAADHPAVKDHYIRKNHKDEYVYALLRGKASFDGQISQGFSGGGATIGGGASVTAEMLMAHPIELKKRDPKKIMTPAELLAEAKEVKEIAFNQIKNLKLLVPSNGQELSDAINDKKLLPGSTILYRRELHGNGGVFAEQGFTGMFTKAVAKVGLGGSISRDRVMSVTVGEGGKFRVQFNEADVKSAYLEAIATAGINGRPVSASLDDLAALDGVAEQVLDKGTGRLISLISKQVNAGARAGKSRTSLRDIEIELDSKNPADLEVFNKLRNSAFEDRVETLQSEDQRRAQNGGKLPYIVRDDEVRSVERSSWIKLLLSEPFTHSKKVQVMQGSIKSSGGGHEPHQGLNLDDSGGGWARNFFDVAQVTTSGVAFKYLDEKGMEHDGAQYNQKLTLPRTGPEEHEYIKRFAERIRVPDYQAPEIILNEHGKTKAVVGASFELLDKQVAKLGNASLEDLLAAAAAADRALNKGRFETISASELAPWTTPQMAELAEQEHRLLSEQQDLTLRLKKPDAQTNVKDLEQKKNKVEEKLSDLERQQKLLQGEAGTASLKFEKDWVNFKSDPTDINRYNQDRLGIPTIQYQYQTKPENKGRLVGKDLEVYKAVKAAWENIQEVKRGDYSATLDVFSLVEGLNPAVATIVIAALAQVSGAVAANFEVEAERSKDTVKFGWKSPLAVGIPNAQSHQKAVGARVFGST